MMFLLEQVNEAHDPFLAMVNCTSDVYLGERRQLCLYKKGKKKLSVCMVEWSEQLSY